VLLFHLERPALAICLHVDPRDELALPQDGTHEVTKLALLFRDVPVPMKLLFSAAADGPKGGDYGEDYRINSRWNWWMAG
jgi:hypothetical protein